MTGVIPRTRATRLALALVVDARCFTRPPGNLGMPLTSLGFESNLIAPDGKYTCFSALAVTPQGSLDLTLAFTIADRFPLLILALPLTDGQLDFR